jgi:hypothetical protein
VERRAGASPDSMLALLLAARPSAERAGHGWAIRGFDRAWKPPPARLRRQHRRVAECRPARGVDALRSELERVGSERNRLAEELSLFREPIIELAHLAKRIDACDREARSLGLTSVRPVLASAPPEIATLLGEVFVFDAFLALARLHIVNKASR